jgi:cold shock CspA family protein
LATLGVCVLGLSMANTAYGYGFYQYGNGRADLATRYETIAGTTLWTAPAGNPVTFDFGNIGGFAADPNLPALFTTVDATTAVVNAGNAWEPWANVTFGNALGAAGTGLVRLQFDNNKAEGAGALGFQATGAAQTYATITFGKQAPGGVAWNADNFQWTMMHELGHVLGLDDLYVDYTEEFVDHPVPGNALPDRPAGFGPEPGARGYADNVMFQNRLDGVDYSKASQTIIDNDEIAAVAWLWGSPYNQIVTGDLATSWNAQGGRDTEEHHGDQNNPPGWWDYRASIVTAGAGKPYIDLDFMGYEQFLATTYPNAAVTYGGNQGGTIERFIIDEVGWTGNLELFVKSEFTQERRINAWVTGGRTDMFTLAPNLAGLTFQGGNQWAQVFGPVPLPNTFLLVGSGLVAFFLVRRKNGFQ